MSSRRERERNHNLPTRRARNDIQIALHARRTAHPRHNYHLPWATSPGTTGQAQLDNANTHRLQGRSFPLSFYPIPSCPVHGNQGWTDIPPAQWHGPLVGCECFGLLPYTPQVDPYPSGYHMISPLHNARSGHSASSHDLFLESHIDIRNGTINQVGHDMYNINNIFVRDLDEWAAYDSAYNFTPPLPIDRSTNIRGTASPLRSTVAPTLPALPKCMEFPGQQNSTTPGMRTTFRYAFFSEEGRLSPKIQTSCLRMDM